MRCTVQPFNSLDAVRMLARLAGQVSKRLVIRLIASSLAGHQRGRRGQGSVGQQPLAPYHTRVDRTSIRVDRAVMASMV